MTPTLERITIYPVKSLDGVACDDARVLPGGALEHDRRWRLVDNDGLVVHAKRTPLVHAIRAGFEVEDGRWLVSLEADERAIRAGAIPGVERLVGLRPAAFPLVPGREGPCGWLGEALGLDLLLQERVEGGFPDDREAAGPTLVAVATLVEVARWFAFGIDEARRRFRVNLEVGGCPMFWEDALASPARAEPGPSLLDLPRDVAADPFAGLPPPEPLAFAVGTARFRATNVCRRCPVPSRDSRTGAVAALFREAFEARRSHGLRPDVDVTGWGHYYRLAINTTGLGAGEVRVGDGVTVG